MKKIFSLATIFLAFVSCDVKSCEEILCGPNQVCNRGVCSCLNGYEGVNCVDLAFTKYIGSYSISQSCIEGNGTFAVFGTVNADGSPVNELLFFNFLGLSHTAIAYIITDQNGQGNYIQFPNQNLGAAQIAGDGYYQDLGGSGRFTIDIQLIQNGQSSFCSYTYF